MSLTLETEILSWNCSFYTSKIKKWNFGVLKLTQNSVVFTQEIKKGNDKERIVTLKATRVLFSNIIKMSKAKSSYIYPSVVIDLNDCQIWISSLQNRDDVFNHIEHFWRDCLFDTRAKNRPEKDNQELLNIAYETKEVLVGASNVLHQQGKQISKASQTMEKIQNDISVAERITGDIESWFGSWRVKKEFKNTLPLMEGSGNSSSNEIIEYPVLFGSIPQESHSCGQIIFRNKDFELLDDKFNVIHSFPMNQISEIKVHSPWDVTIIKRTIGKPSVRIHVTSARMPLLLKILQNSNGCDLDLNCLPKETGEVSEVEDLGVSIKQGTQDIVPSGATILTKEKNISQQDADELSKVLNSMKTLATDIGTEQDAQIKQIENLSENVVRANTRLNSTTARIDYACR